MTSARSVFLYLCVGLAAVAALALSAAAATSSGPHSCCAGTSSAPNSEFLSGHSFNIASQPVACAKSDVLIDPRAGSVLRVASASSAANAHHEFQNRQENAGSTAADAGSSERNEKRGTGSL
jgi:hypothetical protein